MKETRLDNGYDVMIPETWEDADQVLRGVFRHWGNNNSAAIYSACSRIAYGLYSKSDISPSWALYRMMEEIVRRKGAGLTK
jgi:hypothetical protein